MKTVIISVAYLWENVDIDVTWAFEEVSYEA